MAFEKIFLTLTYLVLVDTLVVKNIDEVDIHEEIKSDLANVSNKDNENPINVFHGVYTDCFLGMSFVCLQKKTLLYLRELNKLNEVSVFGDYLKFVKLNASENSHDEEELITGENTEELSNKIDKAVDIFFDNHLIRFSALGKDLLVPRKVEEFVGRKRRKGGGGGGGHGGGDGGKKKMMMMAMMCMKMKLMMMVPAMMGMMGMMSFKGMMFSMMSFLISKMMLLMKILEKKGGGGGGGGGGGWGGDGGWAAGGGGGGAWMPAGQDYGGGGGYDANGQWQSRSIIEDTKKVIYHNEGAPIISYVKPAIRFNNNINDVKPLSLIKNINDEIVKVDHEGPLKSRKKRGIIDVLQNAYMYWTHKVLGPGRKKHYNYPKYKIINGMKYVYNPRRNVNKLKTPKELKPNVVKNTEEDTIPIITIDNYNKGEIVEGVVEGRMNRRKFHKMKQNVNETMDDNPWE